MFMEQPKALQHRFNEEKKKVEKLSWNNTTPNIPTTNNTTVDPSGDPISVSSYVPSVNPYRAPSEQQVGDIK